MGNKEAGRVGGLSRTDQQPSSTFEWRAGGRSGRPAGPTTCKLISRQRGEDGREEEEGRKGKEEKEGDDKGEERGAIVTKKKARGGSGGGIA